MTIETYLRGLDLNKLVMIHNDYCEKANYTNDTVYPMSELDAMLEGSRATEILGSAARNFNIHHRFFYYNGYGCICSFDSKYDMPINVDEIASYAWDNDEDFGDSDIREIMDETNKETEDENGDIVVFDNYENEEDYDYLDEFFYNLFEVAPYGILCWGIIQRWDEYCGGHTLLEIKQDLSDLCKDCVLFKIIKKADGTITLEATHHDGINVFNMRILTEKGREIFETHNLEEIKKKTINWQEVL